MNASGEFCSINQGRFFLKLWRGSYSESHESYVSSSGKRVSSDEVKSLGLPLSQFERECGTELREVQDGDTITFHDSNDWSGGREYVFTLVNIAENFRLLLLVKLFGLSFFEFCRLHFPYTKSEWDKDGRMKKCDT